MPPLSDLLCTVRVHEPPEVQQFFMGVNHGVPDAVPVASSLSASGRTRASGVSGSGPVMQTRLFPSLLYVCKVTA